MYQHSILAYRKVIETCRRPQETCDKDAFQRSRFGFSGEAEVGLYMRLQRACPAGRRVGTYCKTLSHRQSSLRLGSIHIRLQRAHSSNALLVARRPML